MRCPPILSALPLLALAGCMEPGTGRYPSLLPRPIESQSIAEPERSTPSAAPDPTLDRKIAEIEARLDAAAKEFVPAAQNAEAMVAVARGVPEGSDAWLDAQTALSEAEGKRAPVAAAVIELEQLAIDRGAAGLVPYPALDAAVARATALDQEQAKRMQDLDAALKTP